MNRRAFIRLTGVSLLVGAAAHLLGCGTQAHYSDGRGSGAGTDRTGVITFPDTENHSIPYQHKVALTQAERTSGESLIVSIQGNAGHDHTVRLSAEELDNIDKGIRVIKSTSDTNGHYHTVTFS